MTAKLSRHLRNALVVLLVLVALYAAYRYTLHRMVEAKLDTIRKQGYPATLAELDKWYPQPPPGENAAGVYLQAFTKFNKWNTNSQPLKRDSLPIIGNAKLPPRTQALSNEVQSLIAEFLTDNAEAVRLLHKAASIRECRFPVTLTDGVATQLPHLMELRQGARLLSLEGILDSEKGEAEAASAAILDGLSLAHSVQQEPLVVSELMREACQYFALTDLERMLNRTTATDKGLARLATAVFDAESSQSMTRGLVGEVCLDNSVFAMSARRFAQLVMDGLVWPSLEIKKPYILVPAMALYSATGVMDMDHLNFLGIMEGYIYASRKPLPARLNGERVFLARIDSLPRWHILSRTLLPPLPRALIRESTAIARLRTAGLALAMERYRLANGVLPDSLGDLVPRFVDVVPADPYDGRPLRYQKLTKGYVVYSVGEDGNDDGGDEKKDITFTVER